MFLAARLKVALRTMACPAAWALRPGQSRALLKSLFTTRPATAATGTIMYANCPPVGGAAFKRYLRGLRRIGRGEHAPLVAHVAVTDRCEYGCARCSNRSRGGTAQPDPPLENLVRLFGELRAAGTSSVALTGGEPLMRDDLAAIIEACGEELAPMVFTSGQGLDGMRARELRAAGLVAAFISLDHFLPEKHDRIRNKDGAFAQALQAIEACLQAGLYTAAQAVVEPEMLEDDAMGKFLAFCKGLGVHDVVLLEPIPVGCPGGKASLGQAAREKLAALHLKSARDEGPPKITAMAYLEGPQCLGCQAGFSLVYISADGELCPCDFVPLSFGNVFKLGCEKVLGRAARHIKSPSKECLSLWLNGRIQKGQALPVLWESAEAIVSEYRPGEPAEMMRLMAPMRKGAE